MKATDTQKASGSQLQVAMDAIGIQQQPVYVGSGMNDLSADSVGASAVLGGTSDEGAPRNTSQKKSTNNAEINRRNEGDDSIITHAPTLGTQRV
jgi:hypothetical protein